MSGEKLVKSLFRRRTVETDFELEALVEGDEYDKKLMIMLPNLPEWVRKEYTAKEFMCLSAQTRMELSMGADVFKADNDDLAFVRDPE